jgi:hypothetical protein
MKTQNMIVLTLEFTTNSSFQPEEGTPAGPPSNTDYTRLDVAAIRKVSESTRHPRGFRIAAPPG